MDAGYTGSIEGFRIDLEDLQCLEGGRARTCTDQPEFWLPLPRGLWYFVQGENPTLLGSFSEDPVKYSADEQGDSSGVSRGVSKSISWAVLRNCSFSGCRLVTF